VRQESGHAGVSQVPADEKTRPSVRAGGNRLRWELGTFAIVVAAVSFYLWQARSNNSASSVPDRRIYDLRASFASRANACRASGLTIAQLLGHANNTQILLTYVKPLDENTKAVIEALDAARASRPTKSPSVQ
jgi:integrase